MKRYRSALMAGLLALAVAVCDDDGAVVQPPPVVNVSPPDVTVTVPPAPPAVAPLQAMITPPSAEVGVDGMVDFAVGTSGGSGDASWTCTSSDVAVATVEMTATGCRATAVAGGGATITAAVTKGSESTNVAAQLTVSTTTDAFVLVTDIRSDGDGNEDVKGDVEVDVSVERGSQTFERLSLNVDGMEVDAQDFGTAAADDAEQTVHTFTLSFNSAGYEEHGDHIDVDYMNGEHSIQALLKIAGRDDALMSNVVLVEFDNDDGYMVTADLGQSSVMADDGKRWYGGPANGHIMISAMAVSYSGAETGAVTIALAGCDAEEADEGDDHGHGHGGGAAFEFDCEGEDAGRAITVSEGGVEVAMDKILNDLPEANIDMEGPMYAPYFRPNPNNRQNGWVNLAVLLATQAGEHDASDNKDGWLTYNDADEEPGVGGYMPVLRYAEEDDASVEDAIAAAPLSAMNFPGESKEGGYCVVVSAVDALGNESDLPDEDDGMCVIAGLADPNNDDNTDDATGYEALLVALADAEAADPVVEADVTAAKAALADAGLLAGLDITPPGIEIDQDMRINDVANIGFGVDAYDDENDEHNSGLSAVPVLLSIERRDTDDTGCLDIINDPADGTVGEVQTSDDDCDDPIGLPDDDGDIAITFATGATNAYYTVSGAARDQAGNHSMVASETFVFDATVPTATAPAAPAVEAGETFQVASFLNDDLSIREYYVTTNFAGDIRLGVGLPKMVDAFDADMLTHRNKAVSVDVDTYAGVTTTNTTDPSTSTAIEGVTVAVRDQAQQGADAAARHTKQTTALTVTDPGASDNFTNNFSAAFSAIDAVCVAEDFDDDCDSEGDDRTNRMETELEVVATATATGAFSEPFDRVDFWMQDVNGDAWMLGSDTSGESDRVSSSDRRRTWTYSMEVPAAMLYMMTREAGFTPTTDSDSHTVRAFGVNDDGVAYSLSQTVDIDDGEDDQ